MAPPGTCRLGPRVTGSGGVEIATYHLGGDGPPVLLAHATGFHGRCWIPLAPALSEHYTVWALDHRGHGSSGKAPDARYDDWNAFADDMLATTDVLEPGARWRGLGHSLGGAVLFMAELARPGTFENLCVYEPIVPPPMEALHMPDGRGDLNPMSAVARKRRSAFASRAAAHRNYAGKEPFVRFDPEALDAYVTYGFVDSAHGVTLACAPHDEASVYEGAVRHGTWNRLGAIKTPVTVMGGRNDGQMPAALLDEVARRLPEGQVQCFEHLTHFGPFEDPLFVGAAAADAFGSGGADGRSTIAVPAPR